MLERRLIVEVELRGLSGLAAQGVDGAVSDYALRPGPNASPRAVIAGAAAPDREEGLLSDVLGAGAIADDPVGDRVGGPAVAVVEDLERLGVLLRDQGHQFLVAEAF